MEKKSEYRSLFQLARRALFEAQPETLPTWRQSQEICTLANFERHLGHAIRAQRHWIAYDAVHFNPTNDGFRVIGTFASMEAAMDAVECSVGLDFAGAIDTIVPGRMK